MGYGTWLLAVVASTVTGVDAELAQRLVPLWRQITDTEVIWTVTPDKSHEPFVCTRHVIDRGSRNIAPSI